MIRRSFSTLSKTFFNVTEEAIKNKPLLSAQISQKYPVLISPQEANRVLEESSMSQNYTLSLLFSEKQEKATKLEQAEKTVKKYTKQVDGNELDIALKESESNRQKFSIY